MKTLEQLEEDLKAVTDQVGKLFDQIKRGGTQGVDLVPAFLCSIANMFYPADYAKQWGVKYGIGLGNAVVSESLQSQYHIDPPAITHKTRSLDQIMHPLKTSKGPVHLVLMPKQLVAAQSLITHESDTYMEKRAPILRKKQLENPAGKLRVMQAAWAAKGRA